MAIVESTVAAVNPYVGPRSFAYGEPIHGRARQIEELRNIVIAERIVLMYSPSGAGKSSLLEAGLRPELERRDFRVLPTIRVGLEAPTGNRYAVSAMLSLEEGRPDGERLPIGELVTMTLTDYLARVPSGEDGEADPCLFFDQFEEVFTLDPTDQDAKVAFFRDLGGALRDRGRWAVLAMREDFIAQLDPYLDLLPARLRARYRLDLLSPHAAREAIAAPAARAGRRIADEVVTRLVDDLRTVQVQRGLEVGTELGPVVEPVQLQVVCRRLWDTLDVDATEVTGADVGALRSVDESLSDYVDDAVAGAAAASGLAETTIRRWMTDELLTDGGFRTQVDRGPEGGDAGTAVLRHLEDAHLIRSERRRGTSWWELAHDRLVAPLQASNAAWAATHDTPLTRDARAWATQGRPDTLLVRGRRLDLLERDATGTSEPVPPLEQEFLTASRTAERHRRRRLRTGAAAAVVVASVLVGLVVVSQRSAAEARRARAVAIAEQERASAAAAAAEASAKAEAEQAAKAAQEAARADEQKQAAQIGEARFLLLEAQRIAADAPDTAGRLTLTAAPFVTPVQRTGALAAASRALRDASVVTVDKEVYSGLDARVLSLAVADDGTIAIGHPYNVELLDPDGNDRGLEYGDPVATGIHVAMSPDGRWLVATGAWYAPTTVYSLQGTGVPAAVRTVGDTGARVSLMAFSRDSSLLALLSPVAPDTPGVQQLVLVRTDDWSAPTTTFTIATPTSDIGVSLVGPAVTIDENGNVASSGTSAPVSQRSPEVTAVAFGPDGRTIVTGDTNGDVVVRTLDGTEQSRRPTSRLNPTVIRPRPDGSVVVGGPITVDRLDLDGTQTTLGSSVGSLDGLGITVTDEHVLTAKGGRAVLIDIDSGDTAQLPGAMANPIPVVAVSPDGSLLVAAGTSVQRWSTDTAAEVRAVRSPDVGRSGVLAGDDGRFLATFTPPASPSDALLVRYHDLSGDDPDVTLPVAGTAGPYASSCDVGPGVRWATFTDDGKVLVILTGAALLRWDVEARRLLDPFPPLSCSVSSLITGRALTAERAVVYTPGDDGLAQPAVLEFADGSLTSAPAAAGGAAGPAGASADGRIWVVGADGTAASWSPTSRTWSTVALPGVEAPTWLAVAPDGSRVATESAGRLLVFATADGSRVADVRRPADLGTPPVFNADGTGLLYTATTGATIATIDLSNGAVQPVATSVDVSGLFTDLWFVGDRAVAPTASAFAVVACDACAGVEAMTASVRSLLDTVELGTDERSDYNVSLPTPRN